LIAAPSSSERRAPIHGSSTNPVSSDPAIDPTVFAA
jgi:hypothetical protein